MSPEQDIPDTPDWMPRQSVGLRILRFARLKPRPRVLDDVGLIDLVLERLKTVSTTALTFGQGEFVQQLGGFDGRRLIWSTLQYGFTLSLSLLGILGTLAAALGTEDTAWKTIAIIAGAMVAALTALNQTWSPSEKATTSRIGYDQLRGEGWDYVNQLGAYKALRVQPVTPPAVAKSAQQVAAEAYDLFAERVAGITKRGDTGPSGTTTQSASAS